MQLILINRERLLELGSFLVSELDSLISRIRGAWKVEHNDDDTHGHVHADSVATGRLIFSDIITPQAFVTAQIHNFNPEGLGTASMMRLTVLAGIAEVSLTGIQVPQDEAGNVLDGRVLVIENNDPIAVLALEHEHTGSSPRNRVVVPHGPTVAATSARYLMLPRTLTVLIYDASNARWNVVSRSNDDIVSYTEFGTSQNDFAPSDFRAAKVIRLVPTAAGLTLSGFLTTNVPKPSKKTIVNEGIYAFSILHQNTGSVAASRVQCPGGVRYIVNPRESIELYLEIDGTWHILLKADQWVDVTFSAGNFTTDAGTWTLAAGDQTTCAYQLDGNMMTVSFDLRTTTVATNPTQLRIAVPLGRTIARTMSNAILALNNGTQISTAYVQATAGLTYLQLFRDIAATAWDAATDTTRVQGQITFMVQDACASISESHTDVAHGDAAHADADHSDVAHIDIAHGDTHGDSAHTDSAHADTAHVDTTSHSDTAFQDVAHVDTAHSDIAHIDNAHSDVAHVDVFHQDHDDGIEHQDSHLDDPHSDVEHSDAAHTDTAHSDTPHTDVSHIDSTSHSDTAHGDTAHVDGGHDDAHADTPAHQDTTHVDSAHGDTIHADSPGVSVGYHCDSAHTDQ